MSRLIDADIIYQWYRDSFDFEPNEVKFSMLDIRDNLENIPTADVPNMTGDLISRQAAIDAFEPDHPVDWYTTMIVDVLEGLPSVQSVTHEERTKTHACDLISRQDAIDAIRNIKAITGTFDDEILLIDKAQAQTELMMLPSAEPRKKGKWIYGEKSGQDGWYCSECGGFIP